MKRFAELTEQEVLALAIAAEEEDGRIYADFAFALRAGFPATAQVFHDMADEESEHRRRLIELHRDRFGEHIPLVRRQDVKGFLARKPAWTVLPRGIDAVRRQVELMEHEAAHFYARAAERTSDASIRKLLGDLAEAERQHGHAAEHAVAEHIGSTARDEEGVTERRLFVLQVIQPGLAGLMDGSVSTLAPLFAAAFATHNTWETFLVGLAASIGAGISMGFAEALSDDGSMTGRGRPWVRGLICGMMTAIGGLGHTFPYLIPNFEIATALAVLVVVVELAAISWIRARYMDTPLLAAAFQVVVGGVLVFLTGILIGSA